MEHDPIPKNLDLVARLLAVMVLAFASEVLWGLTSGGNESVPWGLWLSNGFAMGLGFGRGRSGAVAVIVGMVLGLLAGQLVLAGHLSGLSVAYTVGNVIEVAVVLWLIGRQIAGSLDLELRSHWLILTAAVVVGASTNAALGAVFYWYGGGSEPIAFGSHLLQGDVLGALVMTPVVVTAPSGLRRWRVMPPQRRVEGVLALSSVVLSFFLVFVGPLNILLGPSSAYLPLITLFWVVLRLGAASSSVAMLVTSLVVMAVTRHGTGPFRFGVGADLGMARAQIFLGVILISSVVVMTSVQAERKARKARQAAEEALVEARRMEAVGRLAGGIAHDFNNLLTVIGGWGEILRDGGDGHAEQAGLNIQDAVGRGADLVNKLLAFSRRESRVQQIVELGTVVVDFEPIVQRLVGTEVAVRVEVRPGRWEMVGDRTDVEQVLLNLCANARDALPKGGKVRIWVGPGSRSGMVMLEVSDDGAGIDDATLKRVFDPFFTTKGPGRGTGLGLAVVHGIVEARGGEVLVSSAVGRGTRVRVMWPEAKSSASFATVSSAATSSRTGRGELIAVIEDDERLLERIEKWLQTFGYRVRCFRQFSEYDRWIDEEATGAIALVVAPRRRHISTGERVAATQLGKRGAKRVLYTISLGDVDTIPEDVVALRKPFLAAELAAAVRESLDD